MCWLEPLYTYYKACNLTAVDFQTIKSDYNIKTCCSFQISPTIQIQLLMLDYFNNTGHKSYRTQSALETESTGMATDSSMQIR